MARPTSDREPPFLLSLLMQPMVWGSLLVLLGSSVLAWAYWSNPGDLEFSQGNTTTTGGGGSTWQPDDVDVETIAAGIDSSNILVQQMRAAELADERLRPDGSTKDSQAPEADSAAEILKRLSGPVAGPIGERSGGGADLGASVVPERIQIGEGESVSGGSSLGGFRADGQFVPSAPGAAPQDPLKAAMDRFNAVQAQSGAGAGRPAIAPGAAPAPGQAYNTTAPIPGGGSSYGMPGAGAYNNTGYNGGGYVPPVVGAPDGRLPASSSLVPPATGVPVGGGYTNRGARDGSTLVPTAPAPVTQETRSAADSGAPVPQAVQTPNNIGGRSFNSFGNPYGGQR